MSFNTHELVLIHNALRDALREEKKYSDDWVLHLTDERGIPRKIKELERLIEKVNHLWEASNINL